MNSLRPLCKFIVCLCLSFSAIAMQDEQSQPQTQSTSFKAPLSDAETTESRTSQRARRGELTDSQKTQKQELNIKLANALKALSTGLPYEEQASQKPTDMGTPIYNKRTRGSLDLRMKLNHSTESTVPDKQNHSSSSHLRKIQLDLSPIQEVEEALESTIKKLGPENVVLNEEENTLLENLAKHSPRIRKMLTDLHRVGSDTSEQHKTKPAEARPVSGTQTPPASFRPKSSTRGDSSPLLRRAVSTSRVRKKGELADDESGKSTDS